MLLKRRTLSGLLLPVWMGAAFIPAFSSHTPRLREGFKYLYGKS